jgi:acyl-CoA thioesterase FadM
MSSPKPAAAHRHRPSVRFRDCEAMGHANHAVYFTYNRDMVYIFGKDT